MKDGDDHGHDESPGASVFDFHEDVVLVNFGAFGTNRFESAKLMEVHDGDVLASHDDDDEVAEDGVCVVARHDDDDDDALDGHGGDISHHDDRVESDGDDEGVKRVVSTNDEVVHGNDHDALYAHDDVVEEGGAYGVYGNVAVVDDDGCGVSHDDVVEESGHEYGLAYEGEAFDDVHVHDDAFRDDNEVEE